MTIDTNNAQQNKTDQPDNGRYRRFLSQLFAVSVKNLLLLDWGLCTSFPGIVIPALTGIPNQHNLNEFLVLTAIQASWLASIGYIFEPLGSVISAFLTDFLGRKRAMMVANIPFAIGWLLLFTANSVTQIFCGIILLAFTGGLIESPIITYIGEITEKNHRGFLIAYSNIFGTIGMMIVFFLNTQFPWRSVGLICMFVPILTIIALYFVPETPLWLLSKNRNAEAEIALCWLRGWVSKEAVAQEFAELQRYSDRSKSCSACTKQSQQCEHPLPTLRDKIKALRRRSTLKPFFIVMSLFFIASFSGMFAMSAFIVQIFKAYQIPMAPDQAAALVQIANNLANLVFMSLIRFTGKRPLYLTMLAGTFLCSAVICGYGFAVLPSGYNSFDKSQQFSLDNPQLAYIPFVCIILWSFCSYCGVNSLPWQLLSEAYPYSTRGIATGLTAALNYVFYFIASKTYFNLETSLSLPGVALLYCVIIAGGFVLMYKVLPETEGRSLEDIELHFSDKNNKFTNHKIPTTRRVSLESVELDKNQLENGCDNRGFSGDK